MDALLILIPLTLAISAGALCAFFWALRNNQFDDPKGNAERILRDD
jgi:cbb3-type cytochrome oxidase maturation protein